MSLGLVEPLLPAAARPEDMREPEIPLNSGPSPDGNQDQSLSYPQGSPTSSNSDNREYLEASHIGIASNSTASKPTASSSSMLEYSPCWGAAAHVSHTHSFLEVQPHSPQCSITNLPAISVSNSGTSNMPCCSCNRADTGNDSSCSFNVVPCSAEAATASGVVCTASTNTGTVSCGSSGSGNSSSSWRPSRLSKSSSDDSEDSHYSNIAWSATATSSQQHTTRLSSCSSSLCSCCSRHRSSSFDGHTAATTVAAAHSHCCTTCTCKQQDAWIRGSSDQLLSYSGLPATCWSTQLALDQQRAKFWAGAKQAGLRPKHVSLHGRYGKAHPGRQYNSSTLAADVAVSLSCRFHLGRLPLLLLLVLTAVTVGFSSSGSSSSFLFPAASALSVRYCDCGQSVEAGLCYDRCYLGWSPMTCSCFKDGRSYSRGCGVKPKACAAESFRLPQLPPVTSRQPFTLVMSADPQLFRNGNDPDDEPVAVRNNRALVGAINRVQELETWPAGAGGGPVQKPESLVVLGDMTEFFQRGEADTFRHFYDPSYPRKNPSDLVALPTWLMLGNHDYVNNVGECGTTDSSGCAQLAVDQMRAALAPGCNSSVWTGLPKQNVTSFDVGSMAYSFDHGSYHFVVLQFNPR